MLNNYLFRQHLVIFLKSKQNIIILKGLHWIKRQNYFFKRVMASGCSLEALQWLIYIEQTDSRLTNSAGERIKIEHKYYRGEKKINDWDIDGYAEVDGTKFFYEFLGCYFHKGCPSCGRPEDRDERFERKKMDLEKLGTLTIMRSCHWKRKLHTLKNQPTPNFPDVYNIFRIGLDSKYFVN